MDTATSRRMRHSRPTAQTAPGNGRTVQILVAKTVRLNACMPLQSHTACTIAGRMRSWRTSRCSIATMNLLDLQNMVDDPCHMGTSEVRLSHARTISRQPLGLSQRRRRTGFHVASARRCEPVQLSKHWSADLPSSFSPHEHGTHNTRFDSRTYALKVLSWLFLFAIMI